MPFEDSQVARTSSDGTPADPNGQGWGERKMEVVAPLEIMEA